jgi:hypothetical protein
MFIVIINSVNDIGNPKERNSADYRAFFRYRQNKNRRQKQAAAF